MVTASLYCCQVSEHAADCTATDHKHARSHFVCRAFDGHNFHPLVEDGKAESGDVLTSRSGRKIQLSRAARAVLRSKGCSDISVSSPMVIKNDKQDKSQGNGYIDVVIDVYMLLLLWNRCLNGRIYAIDNNEFAFLYEVSRFGCGLHECIPSLLDSSFIMAALYNRAGHYVFALWLLSYFLLYFFPRLISAAADWMSAILPHMVWP